MPEITLAQAAAHVRHGSNIGQPLTRRDGVLKVTGGARYAADHHPAPLPFRHGELTPLLSSQARAKRFRPTLTGSLRSAPSRPPATRIAAFVRPSGNPHEGG